MRKLTPWFGANDKPARPGLYEVFRLGVSGSFPRRSFLLWKDGHWWHTESSYPGSGGGARFPASMSFRDDDKWRGLAKEPK